MSRASLNTRRAADAPASSEVEIVLIEIRHPGLAQPLLLSSDNADIFDAAALSYGTWSKWNVTDPGLGRRRRFQFAVMEAILPGDDANETHSAQLALADPDGALTRIVRQTQGQGDVAIGYCLASDPDNQVQEWAGLHLSGVTFAFGEVRLNMSRRALDEEPFPPRRMSRLYFPGLHP
jgi:hypothetical protein